MEDTFVFNFGAGCFGFVIGWITYRTLRRVDTTSISDIATVIGAVGGAAVLGIFEVGSSFGWYAIGLFAGFFIYLLVALAISPSDTVKWMGGDEVGGRGPLRR